MVKRFKTLIDKNWIKAELKVFFALFIALFLVDASADLLKLYNNFDLQVLLDIGKIIFQSVVRAVLTLAFPSLFQHGVVNKKKESPIKSQK